MKEKFDEFLIDAKLHIETTGNDYQYSNEFNYPYEPTTYAVLDRVVKSGLITSKDYLIDYGSGKGRVPIYLNYKTGCRATGVEMVDTFYEKAIENREKYKGKAKVDYVQSKAEEYSVPSDANCFFFFNPFSIQIMKSVMKNIIESYYESPRNMRLFFYYPDDEYIAYMMGIDEFSFLDEIDCKDIFAIDEKRNIVAVFETF